MKILVVDDSFTARMFTKNSIVLCLKKIEVEILEASSGNEAIEILKSEKDIGLIVSDLQMPQMSGKNFLQIIRQIEKTKEIPVVFITSHADNTSINEDLKRTGAYDVLPKPIEIKKIKKVFIDLKILPD